ncbi:MAG: hypothetical protein H6869_02040 [Rhodospirillales bacterium]|nr:hypothetical protein [Rhodospirillales bacterium]
MKVWERDLLDQREELRARNEQEQRLADITEQKDAQVDARVSRIAEESREPVEAVREDFDREGFDAGLAYFPEAQHATLEEQEAAAAAMRLNKIRDEINHAYSDVLKKGNLGLKEGTPRTNITSMNQRGAMMDMMVQQSFQAAYNNNVSFNIGGEDVEFKQGDLHEDAKTLAQREKERLEKLKRDGASVEKIHEAEMRLLNYQRIADLTSPQSGPMDDEKRRQVQSILDSDEAIGQNFMQMYDAREEAKLQAAKIEEIKLEGKVQGLPADQINGRINTMISSMAPEVLERYKDLQKTPEQIEADIAGARNGSTINIDMNGVLSAERTVSFANNVEGKAFASVENISGPFALVADGNQQQRANSNLDLVAGQQVQNDTLDDEVKTLPGRSFP